MADMLLKPDVTLQQVCAAQLACLLWGSSYAHAFSSYLQLSALNNTWCPAQSIKIMSECCCDTALHG